MARILPCIIYCSYILLVRPDPSASKEFKLRRGEREAVTISRDHVVGNINGYSLPKGLRGINA